MIVSNDGHFISVIVAIIFINAILLTVILLTVILLNMLSQYPMGDYSSGTFPNLRTAGIDSCNHEGVKSSGSFAVVDCGFC